jgi:hypothetical protein
VAEHVILHFPAGFLDALILGTLHSDNPPMKGPFSVLFHHTGAQKQKTPGCCHPEVLIAGSRAPGASGAA